MAKKRKGQLADDGIRIGISADDRALICDILNGALADVFVLYARARDFHWHVTGRTFAQDHALFETEYEALDEAIDAIAERIRALGGRALATLSALATNARLQELSSVGMSSDAMIAAMVEGHESIIRTLRDAVEEVDDLDDEGTADFLTGLMEGHEKRAWMLRSHLG
jgi:starvation-inducible DNA-binding protein